MRFQASQNEGAVVTGGRAGLKIARTFPVGPPWDPPCTPNWSMLLRLAPTVPA